jgi:L-alanine-DL-glutamate epimerase-like enolase superfamily enzyme
VKIRSVEAIPVSYPEPNDFNALRHLCLTRLETDDGEVGWGESVTMWPEASFATKALIEGMADLVVGRDPHDLDAIHRSLKDRAWWYGYEGGIASFAVSAIDIALWDLKAKSLGTSVLNLLGGPVHDRLPAIASSHAHHESISAMADEAVEWLSTGLQGMKVGFGKRGDANLGFDHSRDVEYIQAIREAIGPEKKLMIDLGWAVKWDVMTAVRRTRAFDEYQIDWIEEPLGDWDPEGYANLRSKSECLIAYGEKEWTLRGYKRVIDTGTVDVVGVDPGRAEGITGFKKITTLVEEKRRQANAHAWSSAIGTAASLAVSFSSSACKLFEFKPLENPMQHELVENPILHHDGWVYPPTGPGLGITVIEEVVDRFRTENI